MRFLKEFIRFFVIINTGIVLILAINYQSDDVVSPYVFWHIFISSALTSAITAAFFSYEPKRVIPKHVRALLWFGHYLALFVTMLVLGNLFDWVSCSVSGIITMALSVAGVYICTVLLMFALSTNDAKKMNEALKKIRE